MADELKEKKPDLGSGSSSVSAPKAAPTPKPQPKTIPAPAPKAQGSSPAPKQSTVPAPASKQQPKSASPKPSNPFNGNKMPGFEGMDKLWDNMSKSGQKVVDNAKQNQPKPKLTVKQDPVQKQIMDQGFAPKAGSESVKKKWYVNTLNNDMSGEDFVEAETEEEAFNEASKRFPGHGEELSVDAEVEAPEQPVEQEPEWDKNNDPGSATTTKELEDWTRNYLKKDGGLSDEFIEKTVNNLHLDSKKADFYKSKMKEEYERNKASQMFGTDLNKPDNNENIGFESDNEQDMNLYDFARSIGHDDATARTLVAHYKEGGDFAGVPRWKLEEIANGTADKNRWPFK